MAQQQSFPKPSIPVRQPEPSAKAWYAVGLLLCLYTLSFLGRQIISLMVDPIEQHLGVTEVQIGLLIGFAFTLLYTVGGIAFGWLVDAYSRKRIVFWGTLVWSLCSIGCGFAPSFGWLFLGRMGVGIGEATLMPAAYSLLSDIFPRHRLATALSIFTFGGTIGGALSLGFGGLALDMLTHSHGMQTPFGILEPWRAAFVLTGLPGLALAVLAYTLPEPPRLIRTEAQTRVIAPLIILFRTYPGVMASQFIGFPLNAMMGYTLIIWAPAFMGRAYGWQSAQIGPALALTIGMSGTVAALGSGFVADCISERGIRGSHYLLSAMSLALAAPFGLFAFLASNPVHFLLYMSVVYFAASLTLSMGATSLQLLTPPALRGRLSGLYLFCINIVGAGAGPLLVALITQHAFHDRAKLGFAMAIVMPTAALSGALVLGCGRRSYGRIVVAISGPMQAEAIVSNKHIPEESETIASQDATSTADTRDLHSTVVPSKSVRRVADEK